ncbi:MAG: glycosyltransferase [Firmicutes bacterium]|nr:glycosyltransferase [Bacillota bacterium]
MPNYSLLVMLSFISAAGAYFLTPLVIKLFRYRGQLQPNYRGESIPAGVGIIFALCALPALAFYLALAGLSLADAAGFLLLQAAIFTLGMLGLIDDLLGSPQVRGLKGHFRALLSGQLTTGSLKAGGGLTCSLLISSFKSNSLAEIIVNTLALALFTNLLNLLDLRPGRAIKFYLGLAAVTAFRTRLSGPILPALPFIGAVIGYFPYDLRAQAMMGDAGSNMLGISAGILILGQLDYQQRLIALLLLIMLHIIADTYSFSRLITRSRILTFLDHLGTRP